MTKISTFSDKPFSFSPWNHIFGAKNHNFLSQVKILVVLHQLQREWILFYLKWVWNECLHLRTSEMSIDMGRRIVQWVSFLTNRSQIDHHPVDNNNKDDLNENNSSLKTMIKIIKTQNQCIFWSSILSRHLRKCFNQKLKKMCLHHLKKFLDWIAASHLQEI